MICTNCRATVPEGSAFCPECGQRIPAEGRAPGQAAFIPACQQRNPAAAPELQPFPAGGGQPAKKKPVLLWCCLAAAVLIAVGVGLFFLLRKDNAPKEPQREKPEWVLTSVSLFSSGAANPSRLDYTYNEDGNRTSYTRRNSEGDVIASMQAVYNQAGTLERKTENESDGWRYEWKYDQEGRVISYITYLENGTVGEQEQTTYDANGFISGMSVYIDDKEGWIHAACEYDEAARQVRMVWRNNSGEIRFNSVVQYDADGNKRSFDWYTLDGVAFKQTQYTADGKIIGEAHRELNGTLLFSYTREFDEHGNITKMTILPGDDDGPTVTRYENEYDANGNIQKRTEFDRDGNLLRWRIYTWSRFS